MTLIEIFDRTPIENIISTLALKPDRTVFIGPDLKKARRMIARYEKVLENRGMSCEMTTVSVPKNDLCGIAKAIRGIIGGVRENENVVIDISGGDEGVLVAVGMILGTTSSQRIHAFRINPVSRRGILYSINSGQTERYIYDFSYNTQVYLTCEENIIIHGGAVCSKGVNFDVSSPICADVERIWDLCRRDSAGWNYKIGKLSGEVSRFGSDSEVRMISKDVIGSGKNQVDGELWRGITESGLLIIDEEMSHGSVIFFRYKNKIAEECLNKAGSALEYRTYLAGIRAVKDEAPAYNSVETGITIAWDEDSGGGTRNEIDCMLMRGVCPIFISCKNGDVKTDELYKLHTVANKFGCDYAQSILLSTVYFDETNRAFGGHKATLTLKERASDMGIRLISKAHLNTGRSYDSLIEKLT